MRVEVAIARPKCAATNRAGERCGNPAELGTTVCAYHGAAAPQVARKTKERIQLASGSALDALLDILKPRNPCTVCGRSDATRDPVVLAAAKVILDKALQDVKPEEGKADVGFVEFLADEEMAAIDEIVERAKARRERALTEETAGNEYGEYGADYRHNEAGQIINVTPSATGTQPAQADPDENPSGVAVYHPGDAFGADNLPAPSKLVIPVDDPGGDDDDDGE